MGIKGLDLFLHKYPEPLLEDIDVRDVNIVIRGFDLVNYLYFELGNLDIRCGGEYTKFQSIICQFVNALKDCRIEFCVILSSFEVPKTQKHLQKCNKKLALIRELVNTGNAEKQMKPFLASKVFRQTLVELEVPLIYVTGEVDAKIAEIANKLDAMVLADYTDPCIFPLNKGFLFLKDLKWQKVGSQKFCKGKLFRQSVLEKVFETSTNALRVLNLVMSTYYGTTDVNFRNFLENLSKEVTIPPALNRLAFQRPNEIECALVWLKDFKNTDELIQLMKTRVLNLPEEIEEIIRARLQAEPPNVERYIHIIRSGEKVADLKPYCFEMVDGSPEPVSFLPFMVDNQDEISSFMASSAIRQSFYELSCVIEFANEENEDAAERCIVERDRVGQNYEERRLTVRVPNCDEVEKLQLQLTEEEFSDSDQYKEIYDARKKYFFRALKTPNEDFLYAEIHGQENQLLASTCYFWARCQDVTPPDEICKALAFTFSCSYHEVSESSMPGAFCGIPDDCFDKVALHFSAKWQAIVNDTMRLNNILQRLIPNPKIGQVFSGKLFQKAYEYFRENDKLSNEDVAELLFNDMEEPKKFFLKIVEIMMESH